jgi:amino acid transporter
VWFDLIVASAFILLTTWPVARGAEESSRTTLILTIIQYGGLALFAVIMLVAVFSGRQSPTAESPAFFRGETLPAERT